MPVSIGSSGVFKNYKTLLIISGPANCNRLAIVAKIPAKINTGPKYFLKDAKIFLGVDSLKLEYIAENFL